jgi:hypothetical protein
MVAYLAADRGSNYRSALRPVDFSSLTDLHKATRGPQLTPWAA